MATEAATPLFVGERLPGPPPGNKEVIALLEWWVEEAKKGEINFVTVGAVLTKDRLSYDYAGMTGMGAAGQKGLESLAQRNIRTLIAELEYLRNLNEELEALRKGRVVLPRTNLNKSDSFVEYPLVGTPICWDFLIWLVSAEMTRRRLRAPAPLRVAFTRTDEITDDYSDMLFNNVFRALLPMFNAIEDVDAIGGRHNPIYTPMEIVIWAKGGEPVPRPHASVRGREVMDLWLHGTKPVTITLREAAHWSHRNSNLQSWVKFAQDLEAKGQPVVFIRDTVMANEPLPGCAVCPSASWVPDHRMALYEKARANLCTSNGPAGLALFGDRPYLYFIHTYKDEVYIPNNPGWWLGSNGIAVGEQWPWALPSQRIVWAEDTYENISAAWEQLEL